MRDDFWETLDDILYRRTQPDDLAAAGDELRDRVGLCARPERPRMSAAETIAAAIEKMEEIKTIRGVTGDWLWEIDPNVTSPSEDPRVGLVQGGPDVILHRTIDAQLDLLRFARAAAGAQVKGEYPELIVDFGVEFARAILGESS